MEKPKWSVFSAAPGTPAVSWLMMVFFAVFGPVLEP